MNYYDVIVPTENGELLVIQRTKETVDAEYEKQKSCVVYKWLDYGYAKIAQKKLKGFCDHKPIVW